MTIVQTVILAKVSLRPPGRKVDIRVDVQDAIAQAVDAAQLLPRNADPAEAAAEYLEAMVYEDGTAEPPKWLTPGFRSLRS